jgi:hypothetical protein
MASEIRILDLECGGLPEPPITGREEGKPNHTDSLALSGLFSHRVIRRFFFLVIQY